LHAHVVASQAYFLGCVFSVIAEWAAKGQPRTTETRHDFREWAQTLDWIVRNIFAAAPLLDSHDEARERVSDPRRIWLRALCIALRDGGHTGEFYASQLAEYVCEHGLTPPNVREDADEASVARAIGKIMAANFRDSEEVEIDGFTIQRGRRYSQTAEKEKVGRRQGTRRAGTSTTSMPPSLPVTLCRSLVAGLYCRHKPL
jgi:hypothetical protein